MRNAVARAGDEPARLRHGGTKTGKETKAREVTESG
jgi:hypothetical protein